MPKQKSQSPAAQQLVPVAAIERQILLIRGHQVMLDSDLARLYGVATRVLNQAVRRNIQRFPEDFMFQLTWDETIALSRSQIVTLKRGKNPKYRPYVFTEQGVAMLSSVLRSQRAIQVNIVIMRVFVRLRALLLGHKDLVRRLEDLERKYAAHDFRIKQIFDQIRRLMKPRRRQQQIGFVSSEEKK